MAVRDKARKAMWKECDTVTVETQVVTPKVVLDLDLWNTSPQCKKKTKTIVRVKNMSLSETFLIKKRLQLKMDDCI